MPHCAYDRFFVNNRLSAFDLPCWPLSLILAVRMAICWLSVRLDMDAILINILIISRKYKCSKFVRVFYL